MTTRSFLLLTAALTLASRAHAQWGVLDDAVRLTAASTRGASSVARGATTMTRLAPVEAGAAIGSTAARSVSSHSGSIGASSASIAAARTSRIVATTSHVSPVFARAASRAPATITHTSIPRVSLAGAIKVPGRRSGLNPLSVAKAEMRSNQAGRILHGSATKPRLASPARTSDLVARNGGRNRLELASPSRQYRLDLAGKTHYSKALGRPVQTPSTAVGTLNPGAVGKTARPFNMTKADAATREMTMAEERLARRFLDRQAKRAAGGAK